MSEHDNTTAAGPEQSGPAGGGPVDPTPAAGAETAEAATEPAGSEAPPVEEADVHPDTTLAAERLLDLQRLQAEYVNYKRRVDRDRDVVREQAVASVIEALLPVLDDIHLARQHGDLESGPFAAIADKLEATLSRFGVERFGEPGEAFDPNLHEALMHTQAELAPGTEVTTVVQVLQPGYRSGDRVVRAARVAVADPQ
ncbi:MAG: nucleotide exchange factor GrpE [Oryzihumus sp.]|jgi:molecular chaperone GrpE